MNLPEEQYLRGHSTTPTSGHSTTPTITFAMIPEEVLTDKRLSHRDVRVYGILALSRRGAFVSIGERRQAELASIDRRGVRESRNNLVRCGHVEVDLTHGSRARYRLTSPLFFGSVAQPSGVAFGKREMIECPQCHLDRPALCKSGVCRACNLKNKIRVIVREEVVAEIERSA